MTVCENILMQLGGLRRLAAMTGAHNFADHGEGVSFIMKGRNAKGRGNYVKITLNGTDLYDVTIGRIRNYELFVTSSTTNLFVGDLRDFIEQGTGRFLSLSG